MNHLNSLITNNVAHESVSALQVNGQITAAVVWLFI